MCPRQKKNNKQMNWTSEWVFISWRIVRVWAITYIWIGIMTYVWARSMNVEVICDKPRKYWLIAWRININLLYYLGRCYFIRLSKGFALIVASLDILRYLIFYLWTLYNTWKLDEFLYLHFFASMSCTWWMRLLRGDSVI